VEKLLQHGIAADRWLAVIEQATTPRQNVYSYPIHDYLSAAGGNTYVSPALIIIGKVAALSSAFQWRPDSGSRDPYFPPVAANNATKEPTIRNNNPYPPYIIKKSLC
jgi:hypothetical protein